MPPHSRTCFLDKCLVKLYQQNSKSSLIFNYFYLEFLKTLGQKGEKETLRNKLLISFHMVGVFILKNKKILNLFGKLSLLTIEHWFNFSQFYS